jgi:predicted phage tail protein
MATTRTSDTAPELDRPGAKRHSRPGINISPPERVGRVAVGAAAVIAGAILLASTSSALAAVLEVLLAAAGLDMVITGAVGHCPLYARFGHIPKSIGSSS